MELELTIKRNCNNACIFCIHPRPREYRDPPLEKILGAIDRADPEEIDLVSITGGEPTLHQHLFFIIDYARIRHKKARVRLVTNGRALASRELVRALASRKVGVVTEIHAPTPEEHDAITRVPGSYHQTSTGIRNCLEEGVPVELRIVIHKKNYEKIPDLAEHVNREFPGVSLIVMFPLLYSGEARKNLEQLAVSYREFIPLVERVLSRWEPGDTPIRVYHTPLCVVNPEYWGHVEGRTARPPRVREAEACGHCLLRDECALPWATYTLYHGEGEFRPVRDLLLVDHLRNKRREMEPFVKGQVF